jgi:hypothetical protein
MKAVLVGPLKNGKYKPQKQYAYEELKKVEGFSFYQL